MKKLAVFLLGLFLVPCASAADLAKAKAEGKANFYANITAVEPIMEAFRRATGWRGSTPASPPRSTWPRS